MSVYKKADRKACFKGCLHLYQSFEKCYCVDDVGGLLISADLALYDVVTGVAYLLETLYDLGKVCHSFADFDLSAEILARRWVEAVFYVGIHNVFTENGYCVCGICFAVEDEVCGVHVDAEIIKSNLLDNA